MFRRGVVLMVVPMLCIGVLARPAAAQAPGPGYPGPTTTQPPGPTDEQQNGGRVRAGESVVIESCGFAPSTEAPEIDVEVGPLDAEVELAPEAPREVTVQWNGEATGTATVGEDGCARVTVSVHERTGVPACPASRVNDQERAGQRGRNDLVVSGEGANGAARTVTTALAISCSNGAGNGGVGGPAAGSSAPEDGADGDLGVRVSVTPPDAPLFERISSSTPARAGSLAFVLLAIVAVAAVVDVRRRRDRATL